MKRGVKSVKKGKGIARWAAALLCLAMVFSLFVGCHAGNGREEGAGADRTEAGQEQAENRGTKGAALSFVEKDAEERYTSEKILVDGIIRYSAMSRDRTGYRLYAADGAGGWRIHLDGDFREVSREKLDETETVNLYDAGAGEPPYELQLGFDVLGDPDRLIARDGERLFTLPVSAGDEYSVRVFPEEEGLYVLNYDYLVLDGKELRLPEAGGFGRVTVRGMLRLDGRKWVLLENEETHTRHIAEVTGQTVGKAAKTDLTGSSFTPDGRGGTLFVREDELWQTRGNEIVRLFSLRKMGLLAPDCCDLWMEEDRIVIMEEDGIFVIRETEEEAKEEAVIGCVYGVDAFLGNVISAYNLSGEGIVTTHVYSSEEKLNLALLSGEVDLAVSSSPELQRDRARSGALKPLTDAIKVTDIYPHLVELGSVDGNCYFLPDNFRLQGILMPASALGSARERRWFRDVQEFDEALALIPDPDLYKKSVKDEILSMIDPEEWINRNTNTCRFTDESFIRMLEIANRFAADYWTVEANGMDGKSRAFQTCSLENYEEGLMVPLNGLAEFRRDHPGSGVSEEARILPYPGTGRFQGLAIQADALVGLAAKGKHTEAATAFLQFLFSNEGVYGVKKSLLPGNRVGYVAIKNANERLIEEALFDPMPEGVYRDSRTTKEMLERARMELVMLLTDADHYSPHSAGNELAQVVRSEAERYLAGEITAEKAAEYIQNRISLMLAEKG